MEQLHRWVKSRFIKEDQPLPSEKFEALSVIVDGALLASFFDWLMEPIAVKLGYWQWASETIPVYNYICWFLCSLWNCLLVGGNGFLWFVVISTYNSKTKRFK